MHNVTLQPHQPLHPADRAVAMSRHVAVQAALDAHRAGGSGAPHEFRLMVGRRGEELVWHWLRQRQPPGVTVEWVNQHVESGLPYDLVLSSSAGRVYVEVKSSSQDDKDLFEISPAEFDMAARERASYHIYRVSGALNEHPRITQVVDPVGAWRVRRISLLLLA